MKAKSNFLCADRLSSRAAGLGTIQSGANHLTMVIFGLFAVFGDVISQAAQAFMPASVSYFLPC